MISYENYFQKEKFTGILTMPSSDIIWHHLEKSSAIIISEFRKHLFQYVKWIPWSKEFKQKVATIVDYDQLVKEIQEFSSLSE
jgi:tRNA-dihydrouridine synthase